MPFSQCDSVSMVPQARNWKTSITSRLARWVWIQRMLTNRVRWNSVFGGDAKIPTLC